MIIFIIGPRAFGKTTVGKKLAKELNYEFIDVDEPFIKRINKNYGGVKKFYDRKKLTKDEKHEEWFSLYQEELNKVLSKVTKSKDYVLVLGGGALALGEHKETPLIKKILNDNLRKVNELSDLKVLIQPSKSIKECISISWPREQERFKQPDSWREKYEADVKNCLTTYREIADLIITAKTSNEIFNRLLNKLKVMLK